MKSKIRNLALFSLLIVLGGPPVIEAGVSVWTLTGPEGGTINVLAVDPATPATFYACPY
jgi:hypothetical protein